MCHMLARQLPLLLLLLAVAEVTPKPPRKLSGKSWWDEEYPRNHDEYADALV